MSGNGFDPKDVAEICSRKKSKLRMKKADFKELGRNVLLGSLDIATSGFVATGLIASSFKTKKSAKNSTNKCNGWNHGAEGWGNYVNGEKLHYQEDE
ncbi:hypothetical protein [Erwinia mallotivora]|uniref:hypothetical protein n=1 Tax=Erwinia mallotivora TaxID=69222 RepID=UPI0004B7BE75|nr:hypothetical protein [Erwinia mallotivora]